MEKILVISSSVILSIVGLIAASAIHSAFSRRRTVSRVRKEEWLREHRRMKFETLNLLPAPVRNYLSAVISENTEQIRFTTLEQRGEFRSLSQPKWGKLKATLSHSGTIPGMAWHASIKVSPLSWTTAQLLYHDGYGSGYVKFMGIFTIFDPEGKEVSHALLTRILMETVWFPTSLIPGGLLRWEPIDATSARAVITNKGKSVSAVFHFNENNEVERVVTRDKYRDAETSYEREQCTMYCSKYQNFGGVRIPTEVRLEWNMEEGDYEYARISVVSCRFE